MMGPGMMGPGMMGPGMMGPGMMGPGMMGPGMMGPGMMGGQAGPLNLTDEQQNKIAAIQEDISRKHWELMGQMHDEQFKLQQFYSGPTRDQTAINEGYKRISTLRRAMYDSMVDARKRIDAVLTPEQRNQMRRGWNRAWGW